MGVTHAHTLTHALTQIYMCMIIERETTTTHLYLIETIQTYARMYTVIKMYIFV